MNPEIFDDAAHRLETNYWFGKGNLGYPQDHPWESRRGVAYCVSTALIDSDDQEAALALLCEHLGVGGIGSVFFLNDSQPDYETGKAWAIGVHRAIAQKLREGQA